MIRGIVTCILALTTVAPFARAEIYLWPMHGPRYISSSFGEYRDGHFHAGTDLRTFGRMGLPCLAIQDGEAVRVKIAPGGYGKALYVRLDDGRTAVYAHVYGFTLDIDRLTYEWRIGRGVSWCDLHLPEGPFRFSAGDTVCYSGATGTSAPHLHFEIRDERERPLNPLETLYAVPDNSPPVVSGLEAVPISPQSTINGSPAAALFSFRAQGAFNYVLDDTLHLEGIFGFAASLWDEQGFGDYRLAPLEVELSVDGTLVYRLTNRIFDYGQTGEVDLEYDVLGDGPANRYLVLFKKPGSTLTDREGLGLVASRGYGSAEHFVLDEGLHRIEISARDASGNASRAMFHCLVGRRPVIEEARKLSAAPEIIVSASDPAGGSVDGYLYESLDGGDSWMSVRLEPYGRYYRGSPTPADEGIYRFLARNEGGLSAERYFSSVPPRRLEGKVFAELNPALEYAGLSIRIVTDRILVGKPSLRIDFEDGADSLEVYRIGKKAYRSIVPVEMIGEGDAVISVTGVDYRGYALNAVAVSRAFKIERGRERCFLLGDSLRLCLMAKRLWQSGLCIIREVPFPGAPAAGIVPVGPAFSMEYRTDHIEQLRLICEPGEKTGIFRWIEGKGWKCVGVPAMDGGEVSLPGPGVYAFFRDGLPPDFRTVAIEESPKGSGFYKSYRYYVPVSDTGCGIDPYAASAFFNGEPALCEWDDLKGRMYIPMPAARPAGPVRLRVEIADRAGNRTVGEYSFMIQ
jgi:hypothetical protein